MIWARTAPSRSGTARLHGPTRPPDPARSRTSIAAPATSGLRDLSAPRRLSGLDGPWHLVASDLRVDEHQYHWSLAWPTRISRRWTEQRDERGATWLATLERQPALLSITVDGIREQWSPRPSSAATALGGHHLVQRAHWTDAPDPLGLDLQVMTLDLDDTVSVRLTYVNCFVDPEVLDDAGLVLRECIRTAASA